MDLLSSINDIKGVGDKTSKLLNNLGVYTIEDILLFFPRTYFTYPEPTIPNADDINKLFCIVGRLKTFPKTLKTKKGFVTSAIADIDNISVELVWFNAPYVKNSVDAGKTYYFLGKLEKDGLNYKLIQPQVFSKEKYCNLLKQIQPIYPLTKGLTNNYIKKYVVYVLDNIGKIESRLPQKYEEKNNLISYDKAIRLYHFPDNLEDLILARKRLAYEELFFFVLNARLQENNNVSFLNDFKIKRNIITKKVIESLPFVLTNGQMAAYDDIMNDLTGTYVSQRLVQGDVGSGKTIVAFLTMLEVCLSGYQAAIMAPTEVLAKQHFQSFCSMCKEYNIDIPVVLFLGSQKQSEKKMMQEIADENPSCFIIGTHALISEGRHFNNLAYVITDEQHRFGVKQREALSNKGNNPHMMVMSATPIPRTLAMILYGNMHVSTINELPADRLPIKTCVLKESKRGSAYKFISDEIKKTHQVYIICPLVEASETTEAENVLDYANALKEYFKNQYRIGILHGKMKAAEKAYVMDDFSNGNIDILVSTTVVEVGVNVPNATTIMIENANRFGLAALHQLRGRVGRGKDQSYCILMSSEKNEKKDKRLEILLKSNDGFFIASEDLKLRGPGDFFGIRQSGEFSLKIADIYNDATELTSAASDVDELLTTDPNLDNNKELRDNLNLFLANQSYVL